MLGTCQSSFSTKESRDGQDDLRTDLFNSYFRKRAAKA